MGKSVKTGKFPWSIKGVSVEARDFVRTAAAERGIREAWGSLQRDERDDYSRPGWV